MEGQPLEDEGAGEPGHHLVGDAKAAQHLVHRQSLGLGLGEQGGQGTQPAVAGGLAVALVELAPIGRDRVGHRRRIAIRARPAFPEHAGLGDRRPGQQLVLNPPDLRLVTGREHGRDVVAQDQGGAAENALRQLVCLDRRRPVDQLAHLPFGDFGRAPAASPIARRAGGRG